MDINYTEPEIATRPFQAGDVKSAQQWLGKDRVYGGYVYAAGTALLLPAGWTSAKTSTGAYTVTHNLGTTRYSIVATAAGATFGACSVYAINANDFHLSIVSMGASLQDTDFTFILLPATQ
jgi:hypothetical protein